MGKLVNIDKIQYKFMKRKGTVGAVIVLRRLAEKLRSKNKTLFFLFVDLEKTFNYVRRVFLFCLKAKGWHKVYVKWGYVNGAKVVKLIFQSKEN